MSAIATPKLQRTSEVVPYRFTPEQFLQMSELGYFKGQRVHLIRGELFAMPSMKEPNALAITYVADEMRRVFGTRNFIRVQMPIYPDLGSDPEPDVAVIAGSPRSQTGLPKFAILVVEVSDTSFDHDTTTKLELYAEAKYPEYWVLDLEARQLLVFRDPIVLPIDGHTYSTRLILGPTDTVSPLAAPTETIRVADLLP